ncbi:MAG: hypothetical protein ACTHZ6_16170 [Brevibacterium aurantiacum]|uniref:hypothetical protein n=1 Tax=Brevibacterium aurantiacum TaxID=273384 RepID=UPI003F90B98E
MSDTVKSWIEERRRIHELGNDVLLRNSYELERETDLGVRDAKAVEDAHNTFPRALTAIEKVLEQTEFMETDAENHHNQGREDACKALLDYADTLRSVVQSELAKTAIPGTDPSNDPEGDA